MTHRLSYIIPTYNSKDTIGGALDSVIKNGCSSEIILVDDCSSDNTGEAISGYLKNYNNIKYVRNSSRLGAAESRNIGARMACSDTLVFLDSDIVIPENSAEIIEGYFFKNRVSPLPDALVARREKVGLCKDAVSLYKNYWTSFNLSKLRGWTYFLISSFFAIRKEVFLNVGGFRRIHFAEDNDLGYRLISSNYKIYFADELSAWHNKKFSVYSLLQREFKAGREGIKVKARNKALGNIIKNKKFFAVNINFISSFPFAVLFSLAAILSLARLKWQYTLISIASVLIITLLNREFLNYCSFKDCRRGIFYIILMVAQMNAIGAGMLFGFFELLSARLSRIYSLLKLFLSGFFKIFFKNILPPEQVTFFLTNRCNLNCMHCFVNKNAWSENEELKLEEIGKISKNMPKIKFLTITGGEPFLRDDIVDVIMTLHRNLKPFLITILTNANMTDAIIDRLRKILDICKKQDFLVKVSIDGPADLHDRIRLEPGSFEKVSATFIKLKNLRMIYPNLGLGIITTYTNENKDSVAGLYDEVISKLKPDQYGLNLWRPDNANELNDKINIDDFIRVYELVHKRMLVSGRGFFRRFRLAYKIKVCQKIKEIFQDRRYPMKCFAGALNAVIAPNGDVFPCEQLHIKLGNLREAGYSWKKIWRSREADNARGLIRKRACFCTNECYLPFNISYNLKELLALLKIFMPGLNRNFLK